jgi:hypothetical protein
VIAVTPQRASLRPHDRVQSHSDVGGYRSFVINYDTKGEVTQIGLSPQTTQNIVTYDVVITVSNPDLLLEPGMTATVMIVINGRNNVLGATAENTA